jgi:hypothetical protein
MDSEVRWLSVLFQPPLISTCTEGSILVTVRREQEEAKKTALSINANEKLDVSFIINK